MKHLLTCAALALFLPTLAQPPAMSPSPRTADITCCTDRMNWANLKDSISTMLLSEWQLLQTINNQLNIGSPPASRRWSSGQLDSIALSTITKNAQRYYSMSRIWIYGPNGPGDLPCSTWYASDSSACVNGSRTYTYIKLPLSCAGTPPGPVPPASKACSTAPQCTGYSAVTWGTCNSTTGTQTGTYTKIPAGCSGNVPASVPVPVTTRTCSTNYSIAFAGQNPLSLPGCATVQQWQAVSISGATATTTAYTSIPFTSPQTGVKTIVLKNFAGTPTEYTWINDQVRIKGGKFVLASDYTKVLGTVPTTKANVTLTFRNDANNTGSPVTITYLLGNNAYNTAKFTVEGIDLFK